MALEASARFTNREVAERIVDEVIRLRESAAGSDPRQELVAISFLVEELGTNGVDERLAAA